MLIIIFFSEEKNHGIVFKSVKKYIHVSSETLFLLLSLVVFKRLRRKIASESINNGAGKACW